MSVWFLPLIAALMPVVAVHVSLALAISVEAIPACVPYLEGCASISATGRYAPASYVFKPAFMTQAVLLCLYWGLTVRWLRLLAARDGSAVPPFRAIAWLGYISAISLMIYVTFLGTDEPFYQFMRRFGIYGYFLGMVLAQIATARATINMARVLDLRVCRTVGWLQLGCALLPFALGVLNIVLKNVLPEAQADRYENMIEWIVAAFMQVGLALSYWSWRASQLRLHTSVQSAKHG
ncbi:MAG: hypothetical protein AB8C46_10855 [Burkholderiaceae bacterium]